MALTVRSVLRTVVWLAFVGVIGTTIRLLREDENEVLSLEELCYVGCCVALVVGYATYRWNGGKKRDTVILVGPSDSGKTQIFGRLANKNALLSTYSSMEDNEVDLEIKGRTLKIVDCPGADRLRPQLAQKWLQEKRNSLRSIVFVLDASAFPRAARDVADFLYDVLVESNRMVPIVVACNKQDIGLAKSAEVISSILEREVGLINKTRSATLISTDGEKPSTRSLVTPPSNFSWERLQVPIDFIECSALDAGGLDELRAKIKEKEL